MSKKNTISIEKDNFENNSSKKSEEKHILKIPKVKNVPLLRFREFQNEWISTTLDNVIKEFISGQTPSRNNPSLWNGNIPWLTSGELNYNLINNTNEYITKAGKEDKNLKLLDKNTFLIAITGLEAEGTRGSCGILNIKSTINQSCMALIPDSNKLTTSFLYYWYNKVGKKYGIKYTQGTKQQSYNKEILEKLSITIPRSIKEQEKIGTFLSKIDEKITLMEKKNKKLIEFFKFMINYLYSSNNWDKIKISDLGTIITGKTPKTTNKSFYGGNIPFLTPSDNMDPKYLKKTDRYLTEKGVNSVKNMVLPKNSICITCIGSIGKVIITTQQTVTNQQINSIILDENKYDVNFIYYAMQKLGKRLEYDGKNSSVVPIINKKQFSKYEIEIPPIDTQKKIGNILSNINKKIELYKQSIDLMKTYKKGLLQKMFC